MSMNYRSDGMSVSGSLLEWMHSRFERETSLLEFGSGKSTPVLCEFFQVTSVEQASRFKMHSRTTVAPLADGFYPLDLIEPLLEGSYEIILIDGPKGDRSAWLPIACKIDSPVVIIDDSQREENAALVAKLSDRYRIEAIIGDEQFPNRKTTALARR